MLRQIVAEPPTSKVLIDVSNAIVEGFNLANPNTSLSSAIQVEFPDVAVVKTLNTVHAEVMANPGSLASPSLVSLSGNNPAARATAAELLSDLGWSPESRVDLGDISTARAAEHYILRALAPIQACESTKWNLSIEQQSR